MRVSRWLTTGFLLLAAGGPPAQAQGNVTGAWHGLIESPLGEMNLIVTIGRDADGALRGTLESPDQGSGKVPLTSITATGGHLAFTVARAQVSYEGDWVEAEQHWAGVFTQGTEIPLTFRRGLPPERPVVEGLDGLWEGTVTRNGVDLRLILRVVTGDRGTIVTLDSPDLGARGLPVAGFSRTERAVAFTVPASGARFEGAVSDDGMRLNGIWTLPGQRDVELAFVRTNATAEREALRRPQTPKAPGGLPEPDGDE